MKKEEQIRGLIKSITNKYEQSSTEEIEYCEECGTQTSNTLVAECGYSTICEQCVDKAWEDSFHYDSDGRMVSMYKEYYN